jgi:glutaredoxin-related protein
MTEPTLKDKVEELIRDNRVLLFMKGTPDQPRCGSSTRRSTCCPRCSRCVR